jgi:hypothetical protein
MAWSEKQRAVLILGVIHKTPTNSRKIPEPGSGNFSQRGRPNYGFSTPRYSIPRNFSPN